MPNTTANLPTPSPTPDPEKQPKPESNGQQPNLGAIAEEGVTETSEAASQQDSSAPASEAQEKDNANDVGPGKKRRMGHGDGAGLQAGDRPLLENIMDLDAGSEHHKQDSVVKSLSQTAEQAEQVSAGVKNSAEIDGDALLKKKALDDFLEGCVLTDTGERIVAHAAVGYGKTFAVCSTTGQFDLQSGTEIGRRAQKAYFNGKVQREMVALGRETQKSLKEDDYAGLSFVASSPFKSKSISSCTQFPKAYAGVLVRSKDGYEIHIITRTGLRNIIGKTDADNDIDRYYKVNQQTAPWNVEPRRWVEQRGDLATLRQDNPTQPVASEKATEAGDGSELRGPTALSLDSLSDAQKLALLEMLATSLKIGPTSG